MRFVADTSVWIDYFKGLENRQTNFLDDALASRRVVVPDLVLLELLRGLQTTKDADWVTSTLDSLETIFLGGRDIAIAAAKNYRDLRAKGVTIRGSIDLLVGTWCISNEVPLLHNDRDYRMMETHLELQSVVFNDFQ
jgi:predicted nucleic acid-binding protein